jgi:spermidine synthase
MVCAVARGKDKKLNMLVYALTIFTGAFLLFQVQPLIGKFILPWFGGSPGVWTTCMLFFQVVLVGGYAYAHLVSSKLKPRKQAILQLAILTGALIMLPITPGEAWKPSGADTPTWRILTLLAATIGAPYLVLSSTGPLMQRWFTLAQPGRSPYRLFALSNLGSLLALLSYPFYFESQFSRQTQAILWSSGFVFYALCTGAAAWRLWNVPAATAPAAPAALVEKGRVSWTDLMLWLLLPACASALLLATTNKLCLDVAVVPFLWVLPLAIYLLSFIVAFDSPRWYARLPFTFAFAAALAAFCWALFSGTDWPVWRQAATYGGALFVCCMVCHGELYRRRPGAGHLTTFYLLVSIGGALGGVFVALIAPAIFTAYHELPLSLLACAILFVVAVSLRGQAQDGASRYWIWMARIAPIVAAIGTDRWLADLAGNSYINRGYYTAARIGVWGLLLAWIVARLVGRRLAAWKQETEPASMAQPVGKLAGMGWLSLGVVALTFTLWSAAREDDPGVIYKSRNFYGILAVYEYFPQEPESRHLVLQHGRITHGLQFTDPEQSRWATTYFGDETGVGIAMRSFPAGQRRIGIVGLGTGTLATYGEKGDYLRFYEINPEVERLAMDSFTYLRNSPATIELAHGDARLSMESEPDQDFDLLILDAFSSDSIPVHLLTREAFTLYERHLNPDGLLAVHISNHYLDLQPVVQRLAKEAGYEAVLIDYDERDEIWWVYSASWMLLSKNAELLNSDLVRAAATPLDPIRPKAPLWTDDFASLFPILMKD